MKKRPYAAPCAESLSLMSEGCLLTNSSETFYFSNSYDVQGASAQFSRHRTDVSDDCDEED